MTISGAAAVIALFTLWIYVCILHPPILKPWFGLRRPPGNEGRWFT